MIKLNKKYYQSKKSEKLHMGIKSVQQKLHTKYRIVQNSNITHNRYI